MIRIDPDIIMLSISVAIMIFIVLLIYAILGLRKYIKVVISILLIAISISHYNILIYLLRYLKISLYPFIIVESTEQGSVLYPDIGQISLLIVVIIWRDKVREYLSKIHQCLKGLKIDRES
ncbi:MAG: hypothetical protein QXE81_06215 [Desulfurococcaceae archaeon]